ncbi:MAG: type I 3-dehydroquinate dehydratase [Planctomycetota bacterium]|jgi:3-dehydroquinate dehydratase/shikimate dehydrogenase
MTRRPGLLVASVAGRTAEQVAALARRAVDDGADLVELRADACPESDPAVLRRWIPAGVPACYTLRSIAHGGAFPGSEADAVARRDQATAAEFDWVDVEAPVDGGEPLPPLPSGVRTILSLHDTQGVPADAAERCDAMRAHGADVVKIIGTATVPEDAAPLLALHDGRDDVAAWCMGEAGAVSRLLAWRAGAALLFGAADPEAPAAPGQFSNEELVERYRIGALTESTRLYALLGDPVAHSRGPALHNALFQRREVDAIYAAVRTPALASTLSFLERHGLAGASVTIPHKIACAQLVPESERAAAVPAGSANTITLEADGRRAVTSTDGLGIVRAIEESSSQGLRGAVARVLGAGGTARIAAHALRAAGSVVEVCARRDDAARELADELGVASRAWADREAAAAILVNTTPLGMQPDDPLPLKPAMVPGLQTALDAVYTPEVTPFIAAARAANVATVTGVRMFLHQAHAQQVVWAEARGDAPPDFSEVEAVWEDLG